MPIEQLISRLFVRYSSMFSTLRSIPIVGGSLAWLSARLVSRDSMFWFQVHNGLARGLWLKLNPRTGGAYLEGEVEPEVQGALAEHLKPGMVVYDIGANIGFFSLLAARLVGPQGKVIAFEPDPEAAARLREHAKRNQLENISVKEVAVWLETGSVTFARSDPCLSPDRGTGHVDDCANSQRCVQVPAIRLDDCRENVPPHFLKCDVEGAEVNVFRGALALLKQSQPIVVCEFHNAESRDTLADQLTRLSYACSYFADNHILALPKRMSEDQLPND